MAPSVPFNLPDDLVIAIATELKRLEGTTVDLLNSLLSANDGSILGCPFSTATSRSQTRHWFDSSIVSTRAKVDELLERLVPMIPSSVNLRSFSLYVAQSACRSIRRATIIALLEAMPVTCTNLELDTHGQDHRDQDKKAHVCDAVRTLLPRMHHVRIRIGAICSAFFSADEGLHTPRIDCFTTFISPHLKSLVVRCSVISGSQIQLCGQDDCTSSAKHPGRIEELALSSIANGLM